MYLMRCGSIRCFFLLSIMWTINRLAVFGSNRTWDISSRFGLGTFFASDSVNDGRGVGANDGVCFWIGGFGDWTLARNFGASIFVDDFFINFPFLYICHAPNFWKIKINCNYFEFC